MREFLPTPYRLANPGGDGRHPSLSDDGAFLADGTPLLTRSPGGMWRPRAAEDLRKALCLQEGGYDSRAEGVATIARALNQGQSARAAIALLHLRLAPLPEPLIKGSPDQPRVPAGQSDGGQWTRDGGSGSNSATSSPVPKTLDPKGDPSSAPPSSAPPSWVPMVLPATGAPTPITLTPPRGGNGLTATPVAMTTVAPAAAMPSALGSLTPGAAAWLARIAAALSGPTAFLGALLIPTNNNHIVDGTVPGRPDLSYHFDEGMLSITQTAPDGGHRQIFFGGPDKDDVYRLPDGTAFGRFLGPASVALDGDALPAASKPGVGTIVGAQTKTDEPKLCPDPGPDRPSGMKERALAYQEQITGLPRGLAVELNGVVFDGCRTSDGTMLEAKGPGYLQGMAGPNAWQTWYDGGPDMERQMYRQWVAAGSRRIEWYVAEKPLADYLINYALARGYLSITVNYEPARSP